MTFDTSLSAEEVANFLRSYCGRRLPAALLYANSNRFRFAPHDRFDHTLRATSDIFGRSVTTHIPLDLPRSERDGYRNCNCWSPSCIHVDAALVFYVLQHWPDARPLVNAMAEEIRSLSDEGHAFLEAIQKESERRPSPTIRKQGIQPPDDRFFFYCLNVSGASISVYSTKKLRNGGYSKSTKAERNWHVALFRNSDTWSGYDRVNYFDDVGCRLARELYLAGVDLPKSGDLSLAYGVDLSVVLPLIAASGRLYAADSGLDHPLSIGAPETMAAFWQATNNDRWRLELQVAGRTGFRLMNSVQPWYHDPEKHIIGPIGNELSPVVMQLASRKQTLSTTDLPLVNKALVQLPAVDDLPLLPTIETVDLDGVPPLPVFTLKHFPDDYRVEGVVSFEYDGRAVKNKIGDWVVSSSDAMKQVRIKRQHGAEDTTVLELESLLGKSAHSSGGWTYLLSRGDPLDSQSYAAQALSFQRQIVPQLLKKGWRVDYDESFDLRVIDDSSWELSIQDDRHGWYNVRLEIFRNGHPIDLLAILRELLLEPSFVEQICSASPDDGQVWWSRISETDFIEVPVDEVRRLARLLLDMGLSGNSAGNEIKISRFDVDFLQSASGSDKIMVSGADQLLKLATSLAQAPPALEARVLDDFVLPLRDYQKDGVAWLRWRLQHAVGAVLGDEMAVGKTIQTLAHMWIESLDDQGPTSLIVVQPTLLSKWLSEKEKFLPKMKIGLYHGPDRHGGLASMMAENQAVLTTYRTLVLDIDDFLAQRWHIVACDEGHELRNPDTEMARAITALDAKQKIVISGTPMQNKLLDLWTVMNIAVPGLLRDQKWFKRRFVQETDGNDELGGHRRRLLGQITAPFRLSRKNKEVGNSLPPVNTIYRYVDMGEQQAEVYETMRATMDSEVRSLIAESGFAGNQISILAAIGRLRQICCHPTLVKSDAIAADVPSAKLDYLLEMIDELVADGRAVVIVSQWVEMLKLIGQKLDEKRVGYRMLVGKGMSLKRREESLAAFRHGRASCLLMSLGVGGVGLDIPEGDDIIIFDPWWNPKRIEQAIARLTRDDRDKRINAHYLVVKGTLEEGVLKIAERKGEMIASVMESGSGADASLDMADIDMLFTPIVQGVGSR